MGNEIEAVGGTEKPSQAIAEIVVPDLNRVAAAMSALERLKSDILVQDQDKVTIKDKMAITRSGFSKLCVAFGISTSITKIQRIKTADDYIVHVVARASLPNGRYSEANASCAMSEFNGGRIDGTLANVEAKAGTRATSRSIANLVGGGFLSEEEMESGSEQQGKSTGRPAQGITQKQMNYVNGVLIRDNPKKAMILSQYLQQKQRGLETLTQEEASEIIDELKK
jgi:hypothetical protein